MVNLAFYGLGEVYLYIGLTPFLYLHITPGFADFQDGMFHKESAGSLDNRRIYKGNEI